MFWTAKRNFRLAIAAPMIAASLGSTATAAESALSRACAAGDNDARYRACTSIMNQKKKADKRTIANAYINRGWAQMFVPNKRDLARADFESAIKVDPTFAGGYAARGVERHLWGMNPWEDNLFLDVALADYDKAISLDPNFAYAKSLKAQILTENEIDYNIALNLLDEAISLSSNIPIQNYTRAIVHHKLGELGKAVRDYDRALELKYIHPQHALINRALAHWRLGEPAKAEKDFIAAAAIPDQQGLGQKARMDLALMRGELGFKSQEIELLQKEADRYPAGQGSEVGEQRCRALLTLADAYDRQGLSTQAIDVYLAASKEGTGHRVARFRLAQLYERVGRFNDAIALYDDPMLIDYVPDPLMRKIIFANKKNSKSLSNDYSGSCNVEDASALDVRLRLVKLLVKVGRFGRAVELLEEAKRAAPDDRAIDLVLAQVRDRGAGRVTDATTPGALRRIALVIGNGDYNTITDLPNARSDAEAIGTALRKIGFASVDVLRDASHASIARAISQFAEDAAKADWAVVYFAGHGVEVNGENFLIPVDARAKQSHALPDEAIPLNTLVGSIDGAKSLKLVILDACRNNPFAAGSGAAPPGRGTGPTGAPKPSTGVGLAPFRPGGATFIAYAAKDGQVALDGSSGNSPFALSLSARLAEPNLGVEAVFDLVRKDVLAMTANLQEPTTFGTLGAAEFVMNPSLAGPRAEAAPPAR